MMRVNFYNSGCPYNTSINNNVVKLINIYIYISINLYYKKKKNLILFIFYI